jgi:hypothetical protein
MHVNGKLANLMGITALLVMTVAAIVLVYFLIIE